MQGCELAEKYCGEKQVVKKDPSAAGRIALVQQDIVYVVKYEVLKSFKNEVSIAVLKHFWGSSCSM